MEHAPEAVPRKSWEGLLTDYEREEAERERRLPEDAFDLDKLGPDRLVRQPPMGA